MPMPSFSLGELLRALRQKSPTPAQKAAFESALGHLPWISSGATEISSLRMVVLNGRHEGAAATFATKEIVIGSSPDCDAILSDAGVQGRHIVLRWADRGWRVKDVTTSIEVGLSGTVSKLRADGQYHVACGPVYLRFELADQAAKTPDPAAQMTRKALLKAVASGLLFTAVLIGIVYWQQVLSTPSQTQLMAKGANDLPAAGFPEVRVDPDDEQHVALVGFVADEEQAHRLEQWQQRSAFRDARFRVQVASRLVNRLEQDLSSDGVRVSYAGKGRISVAGSTRKLSVKQSLRDFEQALHGAVKVEDHLAYIDDARPAPGRPRPLTFRIVSVMLGVPSYFQTDAGSRYFVGSVLPDGARVISIEATRVLFKQGNSEVVYPLG